MSTSPSVNTSPSTSISPRDRVRLPDGVRIAVVMGRPDFELRGGLRSAVEGYCANYRDALIELSGSDDLADDPDNLGVSLGSVSLRDKLLVLALHGFAPASETMDASGLPVLDEASQVTPDQVVGSAFVGMGRRDNTDAAEMDWIVTRAPWRRRGIGRAVLEAIEQVVASRGRTIVQGWSSHPGGDNADDGTDLLRPQEGPFGVRPDVATRLAANAGYRLVQVERHSVLQLGRFAVPDAPVAPGYRLHRWSGETPQRWLHDVGVLRKGMSTDVPLGEFHIEPIEHDEERVLEADRAALRVMHLCNVGVEHEASGELVGYTSVHIFRTRPAAAFQEDTIVRRDHRGLGLGLALKADNLRQIAAEHPQTERIHTWNAGENDHMWAINTAIGFRTTDLGAGWQRTLS